MLAYDLISETIRKWIKLGKYLPGMKLPKEVDLADQMGVSRKTLRTALDELEASGLIIRRKHAGTLIAEDARERVRVSIVIGIALPSDAKISLSTLYGTGTEEGSVENQLLVRRLLKENFTLNLFFSDWGGDLQMYDGVMVLSPMDSTALLERLADLRKPHIALETHYDYPCVHTVMGDDVSATEACVDELAELGHRRIAFIGGRLGPAERNTGFRRRSDAFRRRCRKRGIEVRPEWIFNEEPVPGKTVFSFRKLLADYPRRARECSAVLCGNGRAVLELENLRREIPGFPVQELRCIDLRPFDCTEQELAFLSRFQGFYRSRSLVADTAYEKFYTWLGDPSYQAQCIRVPYRKNMQLSPEQSSEKSTLLNGGTGG